MLRKAKSVLDLYTSRGGDSGAGVAREGRRTVARVASEVAVPERAASVPAPASPYANTRVSRDLWHSDAFRPRPFRRDWDTLDAYWHDRRFFYAPLTTPTVRFAGRRYNIADPPTSLWWYFPGSYYTPSYKHAALDCRDPVYASRYRAPEYDPSSPSPTKPWSYDGGDVRRGLRLYKEGLASFQTLERNWLSPAAWQRRIDQYKDVYVPAGFYGHRRYFYPVA